MKMLIPFYRKNFIDSLSEDNKEVMRTITLGSSVLINGHCGSVINGCLDSFEEDEIILKINKKSEIAIKGKSIKKIKK
ncbi:MAG: hypothetical protein WC781_05800 [Candidatus Pacearchaeota archaeon]|jgi:hypothetical protein